MDFKTKFTAIRHYSTHKQSPKEIGSLERVFESDRGRILNSAAVRRLQQKTQVFPLERNAAVRSRLTHSIEVMQVGRYITRTIFDLLSSKQKDEFGLTGLERIFETVVEMSCLLHDVGNPPFGHFGEDTIQEWFSDNIDNLAQKAQVTLSESQRRDICHFEGNAQAIRIIHSLQQLNLTFTQIAGVLKYTRVASEPKPADNYLAKKPGYYLSETSLINDIQTQLDIQPGCRHPVAYIMEAADDIAYCIADIEDAVDKGIMSLPVVSEKLKQHYRKIAVEFSIDADVIDEHIDRALLKAQKNKIVASSTYFISLRVGLQTLMVTHAANRFIDNIQACYHGNFNEALLEDKSLAHAVSKTLKEVALEYAFSHPEVENSELQGHHIISSLLNKYARLLTLTEEKFATLFDGKTSHAVEKRLLNKLAKKHVNAYKLASAAHPEHEFYYRCRMIQDNISGMTDDFAYDEYRALYVAN
ncbi:dGTPase [Glaciecola sp. 1036]|uniref:dGTPase n=1 Tax=Alteromonadaceae TaxID=72275 RepID=UPI003D05440A